MSEMFTKCNGFIVSGDPLVYADSATMTGQGTVSEPFGVKSTDLFVQEPLYTGVSGNSAYIGWRPDETVLWSADLSVAVSDRASGTNFNLSETTMNFERLGVYFAKKWPITGQNDLGYGYIEVPTNFLTTQNGNMIIDTCVRGGSNSYVCHNATLLSGCNSNQITECGGFQQSNGSYTGTFVGTAYCHPYLFVGINRKENA